MSDKKCNNDECCCTCVFQKKLMCHPWNGEQLWKGWLKDKIKFGKGQINQQCGWVCSNQFSDGSNKDQYIFFDFEHGLCEYYTNKNKI